MQKLKRSALGTLLLGGLMTACTNTVTPTATPTAINGTVGGWTGGAGTVSLQEGSKLLSSAALNSNGTFQLALPAASAVTPYLTSISSVTFEETGCKGSLTVSDQSARAYAVASLTATAGGNSQTILPVSYAQSSTPTQVSATAEARFWVYADRDVNLSGSLNCTSTQPGVTFDGKLTANARLHTGWNILKASAALTSNPQGTSSSLTLTLENTPDSASFWISEGQGALPGIGSIGNSASDQATLLDRLAKMVPFQK
ncbi:hypothetical protein DAETH_24720 [Deinococcus aetherius]|uniref:Lipoprotein n=1 Tax=Deinococcus aetherius TaxID=200252 RepID=A0ABM8AFC8_9DEIO|nr:hypothetical protein [Deinococcus aetherius]BDP42503.1 hypothetical protein DAETH_24720 [Deinococcus aetherius]